MYTYTCTDAKEIKLEHVMCGSSDVAISVKKSSLCHGLNMHALLIPCKGGGGGAAAV